MRFFIALEIPDQNRLQLQQVQKHLKKLLPQTRLTDNNKLHLTLAFIGEQPDKLKSELINIISDTTKDISRFKVTPAYIDGFPNIHHPHTLWVGVKDDVDKLIIIEERIKDHLLNIGISIDQRRFIPHIAIAKLKDLDINNDLESKVEKIMSSNFDPIVIDTIKLFASVPDGGFHTHNTLAEIKLTT